MTFKDLFKNKAIIIAIISFALGALVYNFSSVIFQEGNPWPQIKGITQLIFGKSDIVKLSGSDNKYLTKSRGGWDAIDGFLRNDGYEFSEQMGSGYFYKSSSSSIIMTRRQYSRFYVIWTIDESNDASKSIDWAEYKNEEHSFSFRYPSLSVDNYLWGSLSETLPLSEILLPNQVLNKGNNFYLHQQYSLKRDQQTGAISKTENVFVPEYDGSYSYPLAWHIVIFNVKDKIELEKIIKTKLGSGCSYKTQIPTEFDGNYRVEISGDGKDLGSTLCPVNYYNYIIYNPDLGKVAFWSTGQECQIGLGFMSENCFDQKISESFHFFQPDNQQKSVVDGLKECLPKSDMASHEKCNELLKQITDYKSCVAAGFSIMKSNPTQCVTPDGRIFVED